ncbi:MAG: cysteine synthase A [Bacteroidales bacterium]
MIYNNVIELIGNTPMVRLNRMTSAEDAEVYVKLEKNNPGGSVKDRAALFIIDAAEQQDLLKPGGTIIEPTSGNTGIGLAMIAAVKGYRMIVVMPETMSVERRMVMAAYGAEIILTEGAKGMNGAIEKAKELAAENNWFMPMQFDNQANPHSHYETTACEILREMPDIDAFVAGVGTGGTISGVGKRLKELNPSIIINAVEPLSSPLLRGGVHSPHKIQGIGAGFVPGNYDPKVVDIVTDVSDEEAFDATRRLAREEGLFVGISSGAAIFAAVKLAKRIGKGHKIVVIAPDSGDKYLSMGVFNG